MGLKDKAQAALVARRGRGALGKCPRLATDITENATVATASLSSLFPIKQQQHRRPPSSASTSHETLVPPKP